VHWVRCFYVAYMNFKENWRMYFKENKVSVQSNNGKGIYFKVQQSFLLKQATFYPLIVSNQITELEFGVIIYGMRSTVCFEF